MIEESKSLRVWRSYISGFSESTRLLYELYLERFLEYTGYDAEELYETRMRHLRSDDPRDRKILEYEIRGSLTRMAEDQELSPSTIRIVYSAVSSFFEAQGLSIDVKTRELPRVVYHGKKVVLKEQIREIMESIGSRNRLRNTALVLVAKDTGLRVSDLSKMTVSWYNSGVETVSSHGERFMAFKPVRAKKTGGVCFPHMGPEAVKAVERYLEERVKAGEDLDEDSPLWVDEKKGGFLSPHGVSLFFTRWTNSLGHDGEDLSAHSFRKFFETNLEAAGMHKNWIGKYFDKTVNDSSAPYSRPEDIPGLLTESYIKHYDALRVYESADVKQLRAKVSELEQDQLDVRDLREEMQEIREYLRKLNVAENLAEELEKQGNN